MEAEQEAKAKQLSFMEALSQAESADDQKSSSKWCASSSALSRTWQYTRE